MKSASVLLWPLAFLISIGNVHGATQCHLKVNKAVAAVSYSTTTGPAGTAVITISASARSSSATPTISSPASSSASSSASATPTLAPFDYSEDKIRGVNLGGWFVLEPWITPSVFEDTGNEAIIDEYTFGLMQDANDALAVLTDHWKTWYTEDDFVEMHAAGINHVRIPLGYWSVPMTADDTDYGTSPYPYIPGAWPYLLKALNWAKAHQIHVIVDLHGLPGSQNGYDNSGQRTSTPQWAVTPANVSRTIDTLVFVAEQIGGMIDVLELANEAAGFTSDVWAANIRQFFQDGYDAVREVAPNLNIMIGDAFLGVSSWYGFLDGTPDALMDYHEYQIFSNDELSRSLDDHISFACTHVAELTSYASSNLWTVVGEWSNAPTDCAKWLNGRGVGARWDGTLGTGYFGSCATWTGSYANFSSEYKTFLRKYWEVQTEVGETVQGWIFWTWKAENADEWSYQKGLEGGWIPQDPMDRLYPNICS